MQINNTQKVLVIVGPTASGKSSLAMRLAESYNGEIINADALQVYKELRVTTARPSLDDEKKVPHHLFGTVSIFEAFDLKRYQDQVRRKITEISQSGNLPIIVGGSGLYVRAAVDDLALPEHNTDPSLRKRLEALNSERGLNFLVDELKRLDKDAIDLIDIKNPRRVIRALELIHLTGSSYSGRHHSMDTPESIFNALFIGIRVPQDVLYANIDARLKVQIKSGLLEEIGELAADHDKRVAPSVLQAIGVKEFLPYVAGKASLETCIDLTLKNTRSFIKRQGTWFRKDIRINWFDVGNGSLEATTSDIRQAIDKWLAN